MSEVFDSDQSWDGVESGIRDALRDAGLADLARDVDESLADEQVAEDVVRRDPRWRVEQLLNAVERYTQDAPRLHARVTKTLSGLGVERIRFADEGRGADAVDVGTSWITEDQAAVVRARLSGLRERLR